MARRETILRYFGPGMLGGITLGDWYGLLRENTFAVASTGLLRAFCITCLSPQNSMFGWLEQMRFSAQVNRVHVPPPLFVLGHWRSGTTHLHNLLTLDQRFAFPNNYQALFPHTFLTMEGVHSSFIEWFLPKQRPMDNIRWTMQSPQEDEFALCITTLKSPYMGWYFPDRRDHYDRFLAFRNVSSREVEQWKAGLMSYLQRLTWKLKRPLVLKSPPHTCRIKSLLDVFPDAKFIHIHRNPFAVFASMRMMLIINFRLHCLQRPRIHDLDEWILRQYRTMHEVFFEERQLIPTGQYHEVCFEELERDPVEQIQRTYEALNLPDFNQAKIAVENYVCSLGGYQKNSYSDLSAEFTTADYRGMAVLFRRMGLSTCAEH